jgi:UDP-N-acetylglucosamine 2-epimerase (non-hydrolysing)|tara:strand:+ start:161 stop:1288 length:1128 start_codon:yes stop_codon:yes gene_type:complete
MKKALFAFGTRPEAIKMAPLVNLFKKDTLNFKTIVAVTAQHREMLDQVLSLFDIKPDFDLDLMAKNQTLDSITCKILSGMSELLEKIKPDLVFVQGDTTTTFISALASFYKKIPVAHIEAGLRTNNIYSPFPEEINRRMTTSISSFHYPPTKLSFDNLLNEGIEKKSICVVGNTVIDSLLETSKKIDLEYEKYINYFNDNYKVTFNNFKTILVTGHRRESFGDGFENICHALKKISKYNKVQIIYPLHLNPNVQEPVKRILGKIKNIYLIKPLDYLPFIFLMKNSYLILTDSGGVQEEAPSLGKPVLVMRDNTERPEGISSGTSKLVGTSVKEITKNVQRLLTNKKKYNSMAQSVNPYGDGFAANKIYKHILSNL